MTSPKRKPYEDSDIRREIVPHKTRFAQTASEERFSITMKRFRNKLRYVSRQKKTIRDQRTGKKIKVDKLTDAQVDTVCVFCTNYFLRFDGHPELEGKFAFPALEKLVKTFPYLAEYERNLIDVIPPDPK